MHSGEKGMRMTVELDNDHGTFWSTNKGLNWSWNRSVKLVPEQSQESHSSMPNSVGCNTWNPQSPIKNMLNRNDHGWSSRTRSSGQQHAYLARNTSVEEHISSCSAHLDNIRMKLKWVLEVEVGKKYLCMDMNFTWRNSWNIASEKNHHFTWNTLQTSLSTLNYLL